MKSEWQTKTYSYSHLKARASEYPETSILDFLQKEGIIPQVVGTLHVPKAVNTNLKPDKIPAGYLADLAYEWDMYGTSTPAEFMQALAFEVAGTPEKENTASNLVRLGRKLEEPMWDGPRKW